MDQENRTPPQGLLPWVESHNGTLVNLNRVHSIVTAFSEGRECVMATVDDGTSFVLALCETRLHAQRTIKAILQRLASGEFGMVIEFASYCQTVNAEGAPE